MAIPGIYKVYLTKVENGIAEKLCEPVTFNLKTLNNGTFEVKDKIELASFNKNLAEFRRVLLASENYKSELINKVKYIKQAILVKGGEALTMLKDAKNTEESLIVLNEKFNGDRSLTKENFHLYQE